jgi:hypothetical protein
MFEEFLKGLRVVLLHVWYFGVEAESKVEGIRGGTKAVSDDLRADFGANTRKLERFRRDCQMIPRGRKIHVFITLHVFE